VAGVWLYHGLWCKLLERCPDQLAVVADAPVVGGRRARTSLRMLGAVEVAFAAWVISARRPREAAWAQTTLLAAMNGGGLAFARRHIPQPKALLAENAAFLALVWWAAVNDE
jgi:hypothetical protein